MYTKLSPLPKLAFLLAVCTFIVCFGIPAQAGYWKVKNYKSSSGAKKIVRYSIYEQRAGELAKSWHTRYTQDAPGSFIYIATHRNEWETSGPYTFSDMQSEALSMYSNAPENVGAPVSTEPVNGNVMMKINIQAIFQWVPSYAGEPPSKYIDFYEQSLVVVEYAHLLPMNNLDYYSPAHPYLGGDFQTVDYKNGLEQQPGVLLESTFPPNGRYPSHMSLYERHDGKVLNRILSNGKTEVPGPKRIVLAETKALNTKHTLLVETKVVYYGGSYFVIPTKFDIAVRRQETLGQFSNTATIAAGAKDSSEHLAEVQVTVSPSGDNSPGYQLGFNNLPINLAPQLLFGQGVKSPEGDAKFIPKTGPILMDASGKTIIGYVRSSDKVISAPSAGNPDQRVTITLLSSSTAPIILDQAMTGEWKMGENGELPWNASFEPNQSKVITFMPRINNTTSNVPIKGHTVKFIVTRVKVLKPDGSEKVYVLAPKWAVPGETFEVASATQMGGYLAFNGTTGFPDVTDGGTGLYKKTLTIPQVTGAVVEDFNLAVEDQGVYRQLPN